MAGPYYLRSTDGSDASDGLSWANAKATYDGVEAVIAAGETCYVSQVHAESSASSIILASPYSGATLTKWIGVNDGAEPPTTIATGNNATVTTASADWTIRGGGYYESLKWTCGPTSTADLTIGSASDDKQFQYFKDCTFSCPSTGANRTVGQVGASGGKTVLQSCLITSASTTGPVSLRGEVELLDCEIISDSTELIGVGITGNRSQRNIVRGLDAESATSATSVAQIQSSGFVHAIIANAGLPSGCTGWVSGTYSVGQRIEIYNADAGDVHTSFYIGEIGGSTTDETTIVRSGGGTVSHRFDSSSSCDNKGLQFQGMRGAIYNESTGSSMTLTVDLVYDSATNLKDTEVWLFVWYHGTSGSPETSLASTKGNILGSGTDLTSSSATWSGTSGFTNENKDKLAATFTPQEVGYIEYAVVIGKASVTALYVDIDGATLA